MNYPTVTCGGCEGSGVSPEDHGQGNIEYLGCMDCMGLGQFKMVPVDAVVLSRQPCNNCDGWFQPYDWCDHGEQDDHTIVCAKPCPSCGGSGTTPGNSYTDEMKWCYVHKVRVNPNDDVCQLIESCLVKRVWIVDVDALVVQEGTGI